MQCKIIIKSNKNTMCFWKRSRVWGLVIQWEGISTQCICGTPQEPFEISVFLVKIVCLIKMVCLVKDGYGRYFWRCDDLVSKFWLKRCEFKNWIFRENYLKFGKNSKQAKNEWRVFARSDEMYLMTWSQLSWIISLGLIISR